MSEIRKNLINSLNEFNELIINLDRNQIEYLIQNENKITSDLNDLIKESDIIKFDQENGGYISKTTNLKFGNEKGILIDGFKYQKIELGKIRIQFVFRDTLFREKTNFWGKNTGKEEYHKNRLLWVYFFPLLKEFLDGNIEIHNVQGFEQPDHHGYKHRWGNSTIYLLNYLERDKIVMSEIEMSFINQIISFFKTKINESSKYSSEIKSDLNTKQNSFITEFDKDGNGELDTVQINDDFVKIVKKYQSKIVDIDRNYVQQFVKISNYQKQKRTNLQSIFEYLSKTENEDELGDYVEHLKEQIHSYELIILHSLNMVTSLINDDMFTFYEIHESFDKLGMFNSNHENEVSQSLKNIDEGISDLMKSINKMERNIVSELNNLSYITQESFSELSNSVSEQLSSIDSSIKFNNLLTGIQTYQMYKVNKNTKSLRG